MVQESFSNFTSRMTPSRIPTDNHSEKQTQNLAPPSNHSVSSYVGTVNYQYQGQDFGQKQDVAPSSGYSVSSYIGTIANAASPDNHSVSSYVGTVNYQNQGQDVSQKQRVTRPCDHSVSSYVGTIANVESSTVMSIGDQSLLSYIGTVTNGSETIVDENYQNEQDVCQNQNVAPPSNNYVTTNVGAVANVRENIIRDSQNMALEQCTSCQDEVTSKDSTIFGQNLKAYCKSCENHILEKCKSDLALKADDELKKELGKMIFAGWTLCSLSCPNCNLPLITHGKGSPSICLRCG